MSKVAGREKGEEKGRKWREWQGIENLRPEYKVHEMTWNHVAQFSKFIKEGKWGLEKLGDLGKSSKLVF